MRLAAALRRGRRAAEARMSGQCTIERQTGTSMDPSNGKVHPTYSRVYEGKFRFKSNGAQASTTEAGLFQYTAMDVGLRVPISAGPFKIGDIVTVTNEPLAPFLVGRKYRITELPTDSQSTDQRLRTEEVSG